MTAIMAVVFAFIGCDEEFTEVGGEIITNPSNVELREDWWGDHNQSF